MGSSKINLYNTKQIEIATLFKALGHPARLAIVQYLLEVQSCICNDIILEIPLAQATISQHLKELKQAGLIKGQIEGKSQCYCLNPEKIEILSLFLSEISFSLKNNSIQCCQ